MLKTGIKRILKSGLVASFIISAVFFASVENVFAASTFSFNYLFTSADVPARIGYMDAAGTWDGSADVSDTSGDDFTFFFQNTGPDIAYDISVSLNVPSGIRVPNNILTGIVPVNFNSSPGPGCNNINNVAVNQAGAGAPVIFTIPPNTNMPVNCSYTFDMGLTTANIGPFNIGNFEIVVGYTEVDNTPPVLINTTAQPGVLVNAGSLSLSKTTATASAINGDQITYNIAVSAVGGGLFDVQIFDIVGPGMTLVSIDEPPGPTFGSPLGATGYQFPYLLMGQTVNLTVVADVTVDPVSAPCPSLTNTASGFHKAGSDSDFVTVTFDTSNALTLTYNPNSFCELCGIGTVNLLVENTGSLSLDNVIATVNLNNPGLRVVGGTTRYAIDGAAPGAPGSAPDPTPLGGGQFEWDLGRIDSTLAALSPQRIEIIFDVERDTSGPADEEGLIDAVINRDITAAASYELLCDATNATLNASTGPVELFLEQPLPQLDKLARNPDAGQLIGNFGDTVFGHKDDNLIWQVEVANTGQADLQNLLLDDNITPDNFDIEYICNSDANAQLAADGTPPAPGCVSTVGPSPVDTVPAIDVDDPFGNPPNDRVAGVIDVDAPEGGSAFIYFVGSIQSSCTNEINTSNVVAWGCEEDDENGGTLVSPGPNGGALPGVNLSDTANLSAQPIAGLNVTHDLTGIDGAQDVGSKGLLTITIDNQTGTTVRNIHLRDILPAEYVVEPTIPDTVDINDNDPGFSITVNPSYGVNYPGMIDTITWDAGTRDADSPGTITSAMLTNTAPEFTLTSSTDADFPVHNHMLRHGDSITITLRVILIDRPHFDLIADLDIVPEVFGLPPIAQPQVADSDPISTFQVRNQLEVTYEDICVAPVADPAQINLDDLFAATPEDLDVDISEVLYILTDVTVPPTPLPLTVDLSNNGGHDADDYELYVTFGEAMVVQLDGSGNPAPGCVPTTNPPPLAVWDVPEPLPASASVFLCDRGVIAPGDTETFVFNVLKNPTIPTDLFDDDLTFRADVVGEITLTDGTPLIFPTVATTSTVPAAQIDNLANNYSLDGIRSRVLGFNLTKVVQGNCTEDNPPPLANENVVIGEDCDYHIEAGGWFGFNTPGFDLIAVQDASVTDPLPSGQGFISTDDGSVASDQGATGIRNIARVPAVVPPLTEGNVGWTFNDAANPIEEKDKFFRVDITTRILNNPLDPFYPFDPLAIPNLHGATSTNIAVAQFDAVFDSQTFTVNETANVPGYPDEPGRRVDLTITEPNLILTKTVCNETLSVEAGNGVGPNCVPFLDLVVDGDTNDDYVYRITLYNELENNGVAGAPVQRSKAHEVIVTDTLGQGAVIRDQIFIRPFDSDGLDNDGDGLGDGVDPDEGSISDNILENGIRPVITFSHTNSAPLVTMLPGDLASTGVNFYYRVDVADTVAPLQRIDSQVDASYDSLAGDSGAQNVPQLLNGHDFNGTYGGSARVYDAIEQDAGIQVIPVVLLPKEIIDVSHSGLAAPATTQQVVIGEEIQYRLTTSLPVAKLRDFTIEDVLPPGIRCVDDNVADNTVLYPTVDLDALPYSAAGFQPGGSFRPVCTQAAAGSGLPDRIIWSFGDQELTLGAPGSRFDFEVDFTVRVENSDLTNEGNTFLNGDEATGGTKVETRYIDEAGSQVVIPFLGVTVEVTEPQVTVTKTFDPVVNADGLDVLLVTVTATNANNATTATAYNLQILDDLTNTKYNYIAGSESSAVPAQIPDNVDLSLGANQPIFNWDNPASEGYALAPGETISFTYEVQVDHTITPIQRLVAPHEVLLNTIEARWTSLPDTQSMLSGVPAGNLDVTTDINNSIPTGFISADGEFLGMRNGQLTGLASPSVNPPNDYNASANDSVEVVPLTIDKVDLTPTPPFEPEIGAHKQFSLTIDLPEGVTNGIIIRDNLAAAVGGLSYVLENDPGATPLYDIVYSFPGIVEINGTDITGFAPATAPEVYEALFTGGAGPVDESTGLIEWNIGTVITDAENDAATNAVNPQIVITYYARIDNVANIIDGVRLQNAAEVNYINGQNAGPEQDTDNTPEITVLEPLLSVTKVFVDNITSPGIQPDAGDVLEYELTVPNSGNATAYDVNVVDTLPPGVLFDSSYTPTATITIAAVPTAVVGFEPDPLGAPAGPLTWGRDNITIPNPNGDQTLDVPAGETLVITYRVVVQNEAEPNQDLTNDVNVDWTSLDGADPLERTGAGCPVVTLPDIYCASIAAPVNVQVIDNNSIDKTRTDDSFVTADDNVRVGDMIEYTLTLTMQEGTTDNIVLTDVLPVGLRYDSIISINGVAAPFANVPPFQHATYDQTVATLVGDETVGTTVTFTLGTLINEGVVDANNPANNDFVIIYQAQLVNDVLPIPQLASTNLQNDIVLDYLDYNGAPPAADPRLLDSEIITAQQPIIFTADISKTATVPSGSRVASGALMDFELKACNVGDGPAYDIALQDIFPNELDISTIRAPGDLINAGTLPVVTYELAAAPGVAVDTLVEGAANDFNYTAPAAPARTMQIDLHNEAKPLLPAQCVVVRYDINVIALGANLSWDNLFQVFEYYSLDAQNVNVAERQRYGLAGPVLFNMNSITPNNPPEKYLESPLDYEATIGELVTYRIVVPSDDDDPAPLALPNPNPMQVNLFDVEIRDTMSSHLEFVSATLDTSALGVFGTQPFGALPGEVLDTSTSSGNQVNIDITNIPVEGGYTRQAFILVTARVVNVADTYSASPTRTFDNTVSYTFSAAPGGGAISPSVGAATTDPADNVSIVEPAVTLDSKTLTTVKVGPPDAGDILSYTLTLSSLGGVPNDIYSDAYDISVIDSLGAGLAYSGNPTVSNSGPYTNTIGVPITAGDGSVATPQTVTWNLSNSNIDMVENDTITITYDVVVVDAALANQALDNSAIIQWTSMDGSVVGERDGTVNSPALRRYISGPMSAPTLVTTDTNILTSKIRLDDTYGSADDDIRVGDLVDYQLTLSLQEGTSQNLLLLDTLPEGLQFEGIVSINGQNDNGGNFAADPARPFIYPAPGFYTQSIASVVSANTDPRAGPTDIQFDLGDLINAGRDALDVEDGNDDFVLVYRARAVDLVQSQLVNLPNPVSPIARQNNIDLNYEISSGISGNFTPSPAATQSTNESLTIRQPNLSIVSKAWVTTGGDNIIEANEVITYTVSIENTGELPAYDVVVQDTIPPGLRAGNVPGNLNVLSVTLASATPFTSVPVVYDPLTGIATWDFDSAAADQVIPAGDTLVIVYEVAAEATIGAGLTGIVNSVQVLRYHSFDNDNPPTPAFIPASLAGVVPVREIYGPSAIMQSPPLQTEQPDPLLKETPAVTTVSIGEPFTYTISVPEVDPTIALYDVQILDDLATVSAPQDVDLVYVGVNKASADGAWIPVNTGTPLNIVIEDIINGIDIPVTGVDDRAVIELTLMFTDSPRNQAGDTYFNTASYTFNQFDGGDITTQGIGGAGTTLLPMTIVEPELTLEKTGPATPVKFGEPIPYALIIENIGDSPAYDVTVADILPSTADNNPPYIGGTCPISPAAVSPGNYIAQLYENDGVTPVGAPLVLGTDFIVTHLAPSCELQVTTLTAAIPPTQKLIITYDAYLDIDSVDGAELTNTAGVIQYFSQDTPNNVAVNNIREYANVIDINDGIQPFEAQYTVTVLAPVLVIQKTVDNLTSGQVAAPNTVMIADPNDELRYTITIQNINPDPETAVPVLSLLDDPDLIAAAPGLFAAGSLKDIVVTANAGAVDASNPNGGIHGTGIVDIQNLSLTEFGGAQDSITISFTMQVAPVVVAGSIIQNQAFVTLPGFSDLGSDDPNINGADNPLILGDEDTTDTLLDAIPTFQVEKTSADLTDDPNILRAGDTIRYTITAKNIGVENSIETLLRDHIPANTVYITSSTTFNGVTLADAANGVSPLQDGILINAPENTTPGYMRADPDTAADNVATVTFDVVVNANVVDGGVISNQAFVVGRGEGSGPFTEQPSDDPSTELANDPTQDVVGFFPIIDSQKTVSISDDNGVAGVVEIGDELQYEITISNSGAAPATSVSLVDAIPANTTYVAESVVFVDPLTDVQTPVTDAALGLVVPVNSLTIRVNSSDLPVHTQAADDGQVTAGNSAIIRFRVLVTAAVGNQVSNQGEVLSVELPIEQTDADGNDENGDQPTVIGIGVNSDLSVTKEVLIVGGGVALPDGELEYIIQVENTGSNNATNIVLTDAYPVGTSYVTDSVRLNGFTSSAFNAGAVTDAGSIQVDYQLAKGALEPAEKFTVSFRVTIDSGLAEGTTITNTAVVNSLEMASPVSDSASIDIGGAPGVGVIGGHIWHEVDRESPAVFTSGTDPNLQDWVVEIFLNGRLFTTSLTDQDGLYSVVGLPPSTSGGGDYNIIFTPPGGDNLSASMGPAAADVFHGADSGTAGEMRLTAITVNPGANISQQNLPVIPHGVVYDSVTRTPVAGVEVRLMDSNGSVNPVDWTLVNNDCLPADSNQRNQTTLSTGFYRFDIQPTLACALNDFIIEINGVPTGFINGTSGVIPPGRAGNTQINIPGCSENADDMILGNGDCDIQNNVQQPDISVPVRTDSTRTGSQGTTYYLEKRVTVNGDVGFNNHIPVDRTLNSQVSISKTSSLVNVTRGQLVPYTITLANNLPAPVYDLDVVDELPPGFKYIAGSARIQSNSGTVKTEPVANANNRVITWANLNVLGPNETVTIRLLLVVGSGVSEGEYVNLAYAVNNLTNSRTEKASATVRVVPDPTFDCSDVIGKIFDDKNLNAYQDEGEEGLPGVRVVTARGLEVTADAHGRFHITCAVVPNADRGSNFIIKLDERSLPTGYRLTTENPRVLRATRGKMLKFNFGAAIHRVVRLDMADAVFEPGTTEMRPQWLPRLDLLITELAKDPSLLRLSYLADNETESEVNERLEAVKEEIEDRWQALDCCYQLTIETEVFWRKGGPTDRGVFDD